MSLLWKARNTIVCAAFGACLALGIGASAQGQINGQADAFASECAAKDITAVTLIEEHGEAEDLPAERLSAATFTVLRARSACYDGRVGEALALYDRILDLGPVASLRRPQP